MHGQYINQLNQLNHFGSNREAIFKGLEYTPVTISEVSLVKLANKLPESVLQLLPVGLLFICLIVVAKIVTEEDASIVKSSCHFRFYF